MKTPSFFLVALVSFPLAAQDFGFPFGKISLQELQQTTYAKDTSANAVYLDEYGETSFENGDSYNLIHQYHARIKILNVRGLGEANFEIPLYRSGANYEKLRTVRATSFSLENSSLKETSFDAKNIMVENRNKYWQIVKFAVPDVRVGSVIEVAYEIETPFIYNFKSWSFQSDIPKVKSTYVANIPALYNYNVSLSGYLKLSRNESKLIKSCLGRSTTHQGGFSVDCSHFTYGMVNIPAFIEEDFMTSRKNFLSAIHFELSEIRQLDGGVDRVTKEWKDAESELKKHENFGGELRRNGDLLKEEIQSVVAAGTDPLEKARKIYRFVQQYFLWDGSDDKYSEGIRKAIQSKKGNAADINLFLVGALQNQDLDAAPVILSTRDNGVVPELYPVLSLFNYVIASLKIGDKTYLLDATDDYYPFGMLPEKCLNGKGRLLADKGSYWVELKPSDRGKNILMTNLILAADGTVRGTLESTFTGYEAISFRKNYSTYRTKQEYIAHMESVLEAVKVIDVEVQNVDDQEKPVLRRLEVEIVASDGISSAPILFNPYLLDKWNENPFKSRQRLYPVDFGVPVEMTTVVSLEYPAGLELVNLPDDLGLSLPNAGGRYIMNARNFENKITLTNSLLINKTVFTAQEYHYLRELFHKVVETQNTDLLFKKKT